MTPALRSSSEPPSFTVPSWSRRIPESSLSSVAALSVVVVPSSESSGAVVPEPSAESVASLAVMSTESTLAGASSSEARSRSAAEEAADGESEQEHHCSGRSRRRANHWSVVKGASGPDRKL